MKFTVENSDIQEVKRVLDEWCDTKLNDDQAKSLIENNSDLSSELFECEGNLDTHSIESIDYAEEVKQTEHKVTAPTKKIDTTIDNK